MQLGFYIDQTRCTGCYTCMVACKDWNDILAGPASWIRVSTIEQGRFPNTFVAFLPSLCYHCDSPLCAWVCPAKAINKNDQNGLVIIDREKCREASHCGIINEKAMGATFRYGEGESPCQIACPAHLSIPGYVALIANGKFKEALGLIRQKMPLPSVCGRVCLAPCEQECCRKDVDQAIAILALKRFVTEHDVEDLPSRLPQTKREEIAIVGSGPAGLAAAYDLIRKGYGVTIYEALPVAGGMLATGIPPYRLPREALKRDIDYIKALGVEIKTNTPVGKGLTLDDLFHQGNQAILLTMGTSRGIKPDIPGKDLKDIYDAVTFLREVNLGRELKVGEKVAVIGGGNAAVDSARVALRKGAGEVHVFYRREKIDMPAVKEEVTAMIQEGAHLRCLTAPIRVMSKNGRVSGLELVLMALEEFDRSGRKTPRPFEKSKYTVDCDMVIFAVGEKPDLSIFANDMINRTQEGTIAFDPETLATSQPGVFAAGDVALGTTNVIEAIASGQKAASSIDRYLQGGGLRIRLRESTRASDVKVEIPASMERQERQPMRLLPIEERRLNFKEVALGFTPEMVIAEAKRCLNCAGHLCLDVCPYEAPQFGAEEKAKMQKCDLCGQRWSRNQKPICVEACRTYALDAGPIEELVAKYGDIKEAEGFIYSPIACPFVVLKPIPMKNRG